VRSVLCLPLLKQAKLIGVLYLEKKSRPPKYSRPNRISLLKMLAVTGGDLLETPVLPASSSGAKRDFRRLVIFQHHRDLHGTPRVSNVEANEGLSTMVGTMMGVVTGAYGRPEPPE